MNSTEINACGSQETGHDGFVFSTAEIQTHVTRASLAVARRSASLYISEVSMRLVFLFAAAISLLPAQTLSIYSGNGQIVTEQFLSTVPLTIQAMDAAGKPAAGVNLTWSVTQGNGTIEGPPTTTTDSSGLTGITFLSTAVPPGNSFGAITVTASSGTSTANFFLTTVLSRLPGGGFAAPPQGQLIQPSPGGTIEGSAGSTLIGAVQVQVIALSGGQAGQPVPNVGMRIRPNTDISQPSAACNAPAGLVLTDSRGIATCDLVLGQQAGTTPLAVIVGEAQTTPTFTLQVTPGIACTYTIAPMSQTFAASGGAGAVGISAAPACAWTAVANAPWIVPAQTSGSGNGNVNYVVAANNGASRAGTVTIAGQTLTISQLGSTGFPPLTITTAPGLPTATTGVAYSAALLASGGSGGYQWTLNGTLPLGLTFSPVGRISGIATTPGTYTFTAVVADSAAAASQTQAFSLTVAANNGQFLITNTAFPNAVVAQPYQQALTSSPGCVTPFSQGPAFRLAAGSALPPGLALRQNPDNSFSVAGTPTTAGTYPFTLIASDACSSVASANFSITVTVAGSATLTVAPVSLQFTLVAGAGAPPSQSLSISATASSPAPLAFIARAATVNGGNWLSLSDSGGTTPATLTVSLVNTAQLAPGTYTGSITLSSAGAGALIVPVTLIVSAQQSTLVVTPMTLTATLPSSGTTIQQFSVAVGSIGTQLPFTVTSSSANGTAWLFTAPGSGVTPATVTVTVNAANLSAGVYSGLVVVSSMAGQQSIPVNLTVLAVSSLSVSPNALSFASDPGAAPASQILNVGSSSSGVAGFHILASTTAGGNWLSVTPNNGLIPAAITVTANPAGLAAGAYTGLISIQASDPLIAGMNIPVTLNVAPSVPAIRSVTSAASFMPGPIAPGEFLTIFGSGLGPAAGSVFTLDAFGDIGTLLSGTRVLFDGMPAPLLYTSSGQVSVIVPYRIAGQVSTSIQVEYGTLSPAISYRLSDAAPAIFTLDASGQGAILNQDGGVNSVQNEATPGSVVSIYATGGGQTSPAAVEGQITGIDPLPRTVLPVSVQIGGKRAEVLYAGGAPGLPAGMLQVNAMVPTGVHGPKLPVTITVDTQVSPPVNMGVR